MVKNTVTVYDEKVTMIQKEDGSRVVVALYDTYVVVFNPDVFVEDSPLICYVEVSSVNSFKQYKVAVWDLCMEGKGSRYFDNPCRQYHLGNGSMLDEDEKKGIKEFVRLVQSQYGLQSVKPVQL